MNDRPTRDGDEQLFTDALHRDLRPDTITVPDLSGIEHTARRRGTRRRRGRQGLAALGAVTVVGLGVGGLAATHGADGGDAGSTVGGFAATPASTSPAPDPEPTVRLSDLNRLDDAGPPTRVDGSGPPDGLRRLETGSPQTSRPPLRLDLSEAYALLDDDGWTAPAVNVIADQKLSYTQDDGPGTMSLNWRPDDLGTDQTAEQQRAVLDARYGSGPDAGSTTIDGDPADVFGSGRTFTVVGPVRDGRFLTLSVTGVTLAEAKRLAGEVHRQTDR